MSSHGKFELRRVIMPADEEDDEVTDIHNYQDIRMELSATGHNLTSVLINPRESLLEDIFDEFAAEQSAPLDYASPLAAANSQGSIFGFSSHAGASGHGMSAHTSTSTHRSGGSSHHSSHSIRGASSSGMAMISSTSLYTTTPAEEQQLTQWIARLNKVYAYYQAVHGQDNVADRYLNHQHTSGTGLGSVVPTPRKVTRMRSSSTDSYPEAGPATIGSGRATGAPPTPAHSSKAKWSKLAGDELRTCYREVPDLFFRADFSLLDPAIFNETLLIKDTNSEGSTSQKGKQPTPLHRGGRTYSTEDVLEVMQRQGLDGRSHDVLSYYLDLVEVALLRQIWLRSPAFFRALDDIKGLQQQVYDATRVVSTARTQLQAGDEAATTDPLRIPRLSRRQRNVGLLHEKLQAVQRVVQGRTAIIALLDVEDYFSAMELIAAAKKVYHEQLAGVHALRQLGRQLDDIDNLVCEVMCNKFVSLAIQWEDTTPVANTGSGRLSSAISASPAATAIQMLDELDSLSAAVSNSSSKGHGSTGDPLTPAAEPKLTQEAALKQLLQSLILTERTQSALNMYKNRLLDAIKLIVRTCVMEYLSFFDPSMAYEDNPFDPYGVSEGNTPGGAQQETPFAQKVREMSGENFLSCLSMCFEHVMVSLQKASLFHQFIERHLSAQIHTSDSAGTTAAASPSAPHAASGIAAVEGTAQALTLSALGVPLDSALGTPTSLTSYDSTNSLSEAVVPFGGSMTASGKADGQGIAGSGTSARTQAHDQLRQTQTQMIATSKACLSAACDLAQRSISQLVSLRKEANAKFTPEKMKFLWEISLNFVLSLEQVSESTAYIMRQSLLSQTKTFLDYLHETCKGKLVVTLDNERWVQCDVSLERQNELDRLSSGKAFLPQTTTQQKAGTGGVGGGNGATAAAGASEKKAAPRDKESRAAVVDGVQYKVVWSVMLLTETVLTYLEVAFNFSPVTADVINKCVELLRLFNSRTRQLVLGAQAIQSAARLKSISAKHLAITGQSLGLLSALLPHIRAALLAQIPPKHQLLLTELDRVSHDLIDHHGQIVAKFVAIVGDFVDASATRLRGVDWDHFQGLQCEYFEEVQRNVLALHRVLQAVLPPAQIQDVFSRIFALLNRKIPAHFEEIMPSTQTGRQRILDEVTHLVTAFSRIKQVDASALTDSLEETFRKRYARVER